MYVCIGGRVRFIFDKLKEKNIHEKKSDKCLVFWRRDKEVWFLKAEGQTENLKFFFLRGENYLSEVFERHE